jgi:predicted phage baseplate assembly protein
VIDRPGTSKLDPCGCCEAEPALLERHANRPGLPALRYLLGTHGSFLRRMLAGLSAELPALTSREGTDPAVALLDAWAVVADVLTFYQERLANEHYLRTATERRSVLELARAIGYELGPGVAASTALAFTLEDLPASPPLAIVPKGTKVQSIPTTGQLPQTFETVEEIEARKEWNALRPRQTQPQRLAIHDSRLHRYAVTGDPALSGIGLRMLAFNELFLVGSGATSGVDDAELAFVQAVPVETIIIRGTSSQLEAGDRLLFVGARGASVASLVLPVQAVTLDPERDQTRVQLEVPPPEPSLPAFVATTTVFLAQLSPPPVPPAFTSGHAVAQLANAVLAEPQLGAVLGANAWSPAQLKALLATPKPTGPSDVFAFRERVGFFGHNAPYYRGLPSELTGPPGPPDDLTPEPPAEPPPLPAYPHDWDTNGWPIWDDSLTNSVYEHADVYLERVVPCLVPDSWVVFEQSTREHRAYRVESTSERSLIGFGLSVRAIGVELLREDGTRLGDDIADKPREWRVRTTTAHVQSERLELVDLPLEDVVPRDAAEIMLDGVAFDLRPGQLVGLNGEQADAAGVSTRELLTIAGVVHHFVDEAGKLLGHTTLRFERGLQHAYVRSTITMNANLALATHGESVQEVLGSGDASQANQGFFLGKPPLTYLSAPTAGGAQSTLEVHVNGVRWEQAPSLYDLGPGEERYVLRHAEDGTAHLVFGDGQRGARLPSGNDNVTAHYRSGIGLEGNLDAGRLSLLLSRPAGVREVANPLPASGGAALESLADARANAPLSVTTLGRVVSLRDYEDFARAFAGVGKAQALPLWDGERQLVHITVAAANGDPVDPQSALYRNLARAIEAARDPAQPVLVGSYVSRSFSMAAKVLVAPRYVVTDVLAAVDASLHAAFAFRQRCFGQTVTAGEVIAVIQDTAGVVATDLDRLYQDLSGPPGKASHLPAATARWSGPSGGNGQAVLPAELLLINPAGITLTEMAP